MFTLALTLLGAFAASLLYLSWSEPRMIYLPSRVIERTPDSLGWRYEPVELATADGERLQGWWLPAQADAPVVLFFNGNAGNISHRFDKLEVLRGLGAAVLIVDYRGYGASSGSPDEQGTYRDADAAYAHLTRTVGVAPARILAYGESLGAAVAIELASRVELGGLVLEGAFTSVPDVAARAFPLLPVRSLVRNRYDSLARIGAVRAPILILHSSEDEFFGLEHPRALQAAARDAQLVLLRGGHNDAFLVSAGAYRAALAAFLQRLGGLPAGNAAATLGPSPPLQ